MSTDYYPYNIIGFKIKKEQMFIKEASFTNWCKCSPQKQALNDEKFCSNCGQRLVIPLENTVSKLENLIEDSHSFCRYKLNNKFDVLVDSNYGKNIYIGKLIRGSMEKDTGEEIIDLSQFFYEITSIRKEIKEILEKHSIEYTFGIWNTTLIN